jgi:DNA-binding Xre family transcriptional regulator
MNTTKKAPGQEFDELLQDARQDPAVAEYLDSVSVSIGNWIMTERLHRNMTQSELAKMAGTTQARISQVESGFDGVKMNTINRICRALKIGVPDYIIKELSAEDAVAREFAHASH